MQQLNRIHRHFILLRAGRIVPFEQNNTARFGFHNRPDQAAAGRLNPVSGHQIRHASDRNRPARQPGNGELK